jgi:hypothetical protein
MLDLALNLIPAVPREDSQQFQKLRQEDFAGRKIYLKKPILQRLIWLFSLIKGAVILGGT